MFVAYLPSAAPLLFRNMLKSTLFLRGADPTPERAADEDDDAGSELSWAAAAFSVDSTVSAVDSSTTAPELRGAVEGAGGRGGGGGAIRVRSAA